MQLEITGHQLPLTDAIKTYVTTKMARLDRRQSLGHAHVILHVDGPDHRAEATVQAANHTVHAEARAPSMYAALDALVDKIARQVRKEKTRRLQSRHDAGSHPLQQAVPM